MKLNTNKIQSNVRTRTITSCGSSMPSTDANAKCETIVVPPAGKPGKPIDITNENNLKLDNQ